MSKEWETEKSGINQREVFETVALWHLCSCHIASFHVSITDTFALIYTFLCN